MHYVAKHLNCNEPKVAEGEWNEDQKLII
jgi:hypothetical protein